MGVLHGNEGLEPVTIDVELGKRYLQQLRFLINDLFFPSSSLDFEVRHPLRYIHRDCYEPSLYLFFSTGSVPHFLSGSTPHTSTRPVSDVTLHNGFTPSPPREVKL